MKLAWHHDAESARYYFDAEVGDYDGVPAVNRLYTDREILFVKDDVMNAAAFLAFATYCSGQLQMPKSCSPELAEAIQEFLKPTWSAVSPIVMQPREAPVGDGFALLVPGEADIEPLPNRWGLSRNVTINILDSSVWAGSMVATDELKLASNAGVLSRFMPDGLQMLPYLAVALLYMESFRCTTLVVPDAMMVNDGDWSRITRVFQSAKLGLLRESKARGFSKVGVTMRKGQSGSLPVLLILNLIRLVAVRLSDE